MNHSQKFSLWCGVHLSGRSAAEHPFVSGKCNIYVTYTFPNISPWNKALCLELYLFFLHTILLSQIKTIKKYLEVTTMCLKVAEFCKIKKRQDFLSVVRKIKK